MTAAQALQIALHFAQGDIKAIALQFEYDFCP